MPEQSRGVWASHVDALRRHRRGAIGLIAFSVAMGLGVWLGTGILDTGVRIFLVILAVLTMFLIGLGYLFPGEDEAEGS